MKENQPIPSAVADGLVSAKFGICIKRIDKTVLFQNPCSIAYCGNVVGTVCKTGCLEFYVESVHKHLNIGTQFFTNQKMHGGMHDVLLINDGNFLTTVFYPHELDQSELLRSLTEFGLTERELEVLFLMIKGITNETIEKKLFIAKQTLKTHINNIYKKLPGEVQSTVLKKRGGNQSQNETKI